MRKVAVRLGVFVVGVVVGVPSIARAQMAAPPTTLRVTVTQVKADMLDEWLQLQKNELVPALKKGGVKTRTVYSSGLFGTTGEFLSITPIEKFADFDNPNPQTRALGAEGAAKLTAKLRKCIASQHSYLITRMEDLGNTTPTPPNFLVSTRVRIPVGKIAEFQNIVKTELTPIYKKANATVHGESAGNRRQPERHHPLVRHQQDGRNGRRIAAREAAWSGGIPQARRQNHQPWPGHRAGDACPCQRVELLTIRCR